MITPNSSPLDLSKAYPLPKVKQLTGGTLTKKSFQVQLQGLMLSSLETYALERGLSLGQAMTDILQFRLVKDGYLPEWWFIRRGIH